MSGGWLIVCGPSGAGKDAVIAWAQDALARDERVVFARRLVTRSPQPGSDHEETDRAALRALHAAGGLAWYWEANGHCYGVRSGYRVEVERGRLVVVNGSREHAAAQAGRRDVRAVLVTADGGLLQSRLSARGREDAAAVAARLARNAAVAQPPVQRVIVNDGTLEAAGQALRDYVLQVCR